MRLLLSGVGQGALDYAMKKLDCTIDQVAPTPQEGKLILDDISAWVSTVDDPKSVLDQLLQQNPDLVILCTEVGCGVVPVDKGQRAWREQVGRLCTYLATRAEGVERIFCGLPLVLKGEGDWC